jgi:hypothetical protein
MANVQVLLTNGILYMGELADQPSVACVAMQVGSRLTDKAQ